jgi:hypothetical protein
VFRCVGDTWKHGVSIWNRISMYKTTKVITTSGFLSAILNAAYRATHIAYICEPSQRCYPKCLEQPSPFLYDLANYRSLGYFRFGGRHIEFLAGENNALYRDVLVLISDSHNCWKPHQYSTMCIIFIRYNKDTGFAWNSGRMSMFPAAILDSRVRVEQNFFHHFVGDSYTGKVTKAFPLIPSGYGAAAERSAWGVILPPPPLGYIRVKVVTRV